MKKDAILLALTCVALAFVACQSSSPTTQKPPDKSEWTITFGTLSNQPLPPEAQAADYLRRAIDGTATTYWQSKAEAHAGMYLDLDLGQARKIHGVVLDSSNNVLAEDYPRGLVIFGGTEAGHLNELVRDYNTKPVNGRVRMEFAPVDVRYLRLQLLGGAPNKWWSVSEIDLLE